MKQLETALLGCENEDDSFNFLIDTLVPTIHRSDWFVDWQRIKANVAPHVRELALLNTVVGSENIERDLAALIADYPKVLRVMPLLLASREHSFDVMVDAKNLIVERFDFEGKSPTKDDVASCIRFLRDSGLLGILSDRRIKSIADYYFGIEVGLDSNARKNRSGELMESLVENFVVETAGELQAEYMAQATAAKVKSAWDFNLMMDKSERRVDFAIFKDDHLFLVETNFYGGGGSKLKSTATEYCEMFERYSAQHNVDFLWITDGFGWKGTQPPLREYCRKADYLLNLTTVRTKRLLTNILGELLAL
ncbi:MAG: type II restriction endonuclease [Kiritimatiellae bacterium]|nr:type II restriction endonuclease [Kiritimatiellia bacterium]